MKLPEFDDFSKSGSQVKNGQSYELSCLALHKHVTGEVPHVDDGADLGKW